METQENKQDTGHQSGQAGTGGARTYAGGCHCGAVQFRVTADLGQGAGRCNCSLCAKMAKTGGIVKPEAFELLSGEEHLSFYEWGGRTAKFYFCKRCGIHCFGRGDLAVLGGAYVSVNYNCLEGVELRDLKVIYWDGRHNNWAAGPREQPWAILAGAAA
ncbi:MAG TPA: GFA family protein [Polyangia bacterium]|nr:GFA family protein [Polyangia bacterium]